MLKNRIAYTALAPDWPETGFPTRTSYNAASALYDFIMVDLTEEHPLKTALKQKADKVLDEMGLLTRAENEKLWYSINYGETSAAQKWLSKNATLKRCRSFNKRLLDSLTLLDSARFALEEIAAYVPIVCITGPIYAVAWNNASDIGEFSEIPFCITSFRKRGWPGRVRRKLTYRRPEVPVIVTNPDHLQDVLNIGYNWLQEARKTARELVVARKERLPLETHLCRRIADLFVQDAYSAIYRAEAGT